MLTILNKFSFKELIRFEEFLCSPYFNKIKAAIVLFHYLKKGYPFINEEYISRANISLHVYSESEVNDIKVRKLISQFYMLIKKFLLYESLRKNYAANELISIKYLEDTDLDRFLPKVYSELQKYFNKNKLKNKDHYNNLIDLKRNKYLRNVKKELKVDGNLIRSGYRNVDHLYLIRKLEIYYDSLTLNTDLSDSPDELISLKSVLDHISSRRDHYKKNHPILYFKYLGVKLKSTMDDQYEQELLTCFKKDIMKYDEDFSFSYYSFLENFYYKKTGERGDYYKRKLIGIFDDIYVKGLYVKSGSLRYPKMLSRNYLRVVQMAFSLKEFEWAEKFIHRSKSALFPVNADEIYKLSLARLHFEKNDYKNSLLYLNKVVYKDSYCYINSKFLLARIYFEDGKYSSVESIVKSLQKQLSRNKKLSRFENIHIKKFIYYIPRLLKVIKADEKNKGYLASVLRKKLDDENEHIAFKNWYYEKIVDS